MLETVHTRQTPVNRQHEREDRGFCVEQSWRTTAILPGCRVGITSRHDVKLHSLGKEGTEYGSFG